MTNRFLSGLLAAAALTGAFQSTCSMADGDGLWPTSNNAYDGQRYSPAESITPQNAGTLKRACEAQLGDAGSFHCGARRTSYTLDDVGNHHLLAPLASAAEPKAPTKPAQ